MPYLKLITFIVLFIVLNLECRAQNNRSMLLISNNRTISPSINLRLGLHKDIDPVFFEKKRGRIKRNSGIIITLAGGTLTSLGMVLLDYQNRKVVYQSLKWKGRLDHNIKSFFGYVALPAGLAIVITGNIKWRNGSRILKGMKKRLSENE